MQLTLTVEERASQEIQHVTKQEDGLLWIDPAVQEKV